MQFGRNEKQHLFKTLRKTTSLYESCMLVSEVFLFCPIGHTSSTAVMLQMSVLINV